MPGPALDNSTSPSPQLRTRSIMRSVELHAMRAAEYAAVIIWRCARWLKDWEAIRQDSRHAHRSSGRRALAPFDRAIAF
eukprot:2541406-Pyramimonas_sp.AAC.2